MSVVADFSTVVATIFVTLVWDGVEVSPEECAVTTIGPWELGGGHVTPWRLEKKYVNKYVNKCVKKKQV